jgi:predicted regulator of Ras-like GTPase activity (Roadblock/LC7/MglB family)
MGHEAMQQEERGFAGAVAGLSLADVIQLNGINRLTGCLTVEYGELLGQIFFRDGEVIHAEAAGESGVGAFYQIVIWPTGKFQLRPKVTTTSHTIRQSIAFLLLEAHRLMDELGRGATVGDELVKETKMQSPAARVQGVAGVEYAAILDQDGSPLGDSTFQAEALAAEGVYLATVGNQLGKALGLGGVTSAAIQGKERQLLLFESKGRYLSVSVRGDQQLAAVESAIRGVLTSKA